MRLPALMLLIASAVASANEEALESSSLELRGGMVIDNTITRIGHDFAQAFSSRRLSSGANTYSGTLTLIERPSARWGSLIVIMDGQNTVQSLFITPGRMDVRALAEQMADTMNENLQRRRLQRLVQNAELGRDELE